MIWQNISAMSAPESADAPVNRPSMKKWVVLLVVLGALIGLGTMVKAWMDRRSGAAAQPVVFQEAVSTGTRMRCLFPCSAEHVMKRNSVSGPVQTMPGHSANWEINGNLKRSIT